MFVSAELMMPAKNKTIPNGSKEAGRKVLRASVKISVESSPGECFAMKRPIISRKKQTIMTGMIANASPRVSVFLFFAA